MEVKELIMKEIENIPSEYLSEVLDFIRFIEKKAAEEKLGTFFASETSLSKDWLKPEEDEAWREL